MPEDAELELLTRSVGQNRIVDEFILRLTHTVRMDWFAPGIEPTGRPLAVPQVAVIAFEDGLIASEHIYWIRRASGADGPVGGSLPVMGAKQADRLLNPDAPANQLIDRL
jgi:carboxymethylenebutenolidase